MRQQSKGESRQETLKSGPRTFDQEVASLREKNVNCAGATFLIRHSAPVSRYLSAWNRAEWKGEEWNGWRGSGGVEG